MLEKAPAFTTIPLATGVNLHHRPAGGLKTETVRIWFRGAIDGRSAARQLYAALLGRGVAGFPDRRALAAHLLDLYGASYGAGVIRIVGREVLGLRASTVAGRFLPGRPRNLRSILELLARAVEGPLASGGGPDPSVFEEERRNLLRDHAARSNHRPAYAARRLGEELFLPHPLGTPETGTAEEIAAVEPAAAMQAGRGLVECGEVDVYVVGGGKPAAVERLVRSTLGLPPRPRERFELRGLRAPRRRPRTVHEPMALRQVRLALGWRIRDWNCRKDAPAAVLTDAVLGGGPSSRLFRRLREERSLCYDIASHIDAATGTLVVSAGVDPSRRVEAIRAIRGEIADLASVGCSAAEAETARAAIRAALTGIADAPGGLIGWFYGRRLLGRTETSLVAIAASVDRMPAAAVGRLLARGGLDTIFTLGGGGGSCGVD